MKHATLACAAAILCPGCILDIVPRELTPPDGEVAPDAPVDDGGEADGDEEAAADGSCDASCPDGWTPRCAGGKSWCVTSMTQGAETCCGAWERCASLDPRAVPGFWPDAGPYPGVFPPDFEILNVIPLVTISTSNADGGANVSKLDCFELDGERAWGEVHDDICTGTPTCSAVGSGRGGCAASFVGCTCLMSFWCALY